MSTVLVVAREKEDRDRLASWLEEEGVGSVMACPGPTGPDACIGIRGPRCPLAGAADAVVLDLGVTGDPGGGVAGWELLDAYQGLGLGVVVLGEPGDTMRAAQPGARLLPRDADRLEVLQAIRRAIAGALQATTSTGT